jgi:hypothetical protein
VQFDEHQLAVYRGLAAMVKIDFDRPVLDFNWTGNHKKFETSPEQSSPSAKRLRTLEDLTNLPSLIPQELSSSQFAGLNKQQNRASVDEGKVEPASDDIEAIDDCINDDMQAQPDDQEALLAAAPSSEDQTDVAANPSPEECLRMDFVPKLQNSAENDEKSQREENLRSIYQPQPVSSSRFFNCFSWLAQMTKPEQTLHQSAIRDEQKAEATLPESDLERALRESASLYEASQVSLAEARSRLQSVMEMHNAKEIPVEADGNCQFRALSQQLYGDESQHDTIRANMVQWLKSKPEQYAGFVHEPFDDYIARLACNGEWGDNVTLQAASDMLSREIHILTDQQGAEFVKVHPADKGTAGPLAPLRLAFLAEVHYDAVELL